MRPGLCCISLRLKEDGFRHQTMTFKRFSSLPRAEALSVLGDRILNNLAVTNKTIQYSDFPFSQNFSPNKFTTKSEFPFGYSLSQGRLLYYYAKHITYSIPSTFPFEKIKYKICQKNSIESFDVTLEDDIETEDTLKSAILDSFDFEMGWIENNYKNNYCHHIKEL